MSLDVFVLQLLLNGNELWVYDGTNPATMVADIYGGVNSGSPRFFNVLNNKLYFAASSAASGNELWVYDGTNPPSLAADINAGAGGSWVHDMTVFQDKLYFQANDGIHGSELWSYDGASASLAQDIRPLASSGNPGRLTVLSDKLYFSANNGTDGVELWSYDGTNPAAMVEDIRPGPDSSNPSELTVFEDRLYFVAKDGTNGTELWVYDGTNATGFDMNQTGSGIEDFMGPNGQLVSTSMGLFFRATDGITGFELWRIAPAPAAAPAAAPAPVAVYTGPLPTSYSDRTPAVGDEVTISGLRLSTITSCTIDGVSAVISNLSADSFTITIPDGTTTGLKNLVISSSYGILTAQGAFTVTEAAKPAEVVVPTAKTNAGSFNGHVAVYAKGHKGKTLSWKIAGKWFKTKITSDYQVFQRKTAAIGPNVTVHLYIDGKKQLTKTVKTR